MPQGGEYIQITIKDEYSVTFTCTAIKCDQKIYLSYTDARIICGSYPFGYYANHILLGTGLLEYTNPNEHILVGLNSYYNIDLLNVYY